MSITSIGFFVIPISLYLFLKNRQESLFYFFVFFTPFSAASIIVREGSAFGMQPSYWIGILLIALTSIRILKSWEIHISRTQSQFVILISLFWLLSLISLSYPFIHSILGIKILLINPITDLKDLGVIYSDELHRHSMTGLLYLTFDLLVAIVTMLYLDSLEKLIKTIKVLLMSVLFICCWGIFIQETSFFLGFDYPTWIFNNHPGYAQGFDAKFWSGGKFIPRINSVAPEPSYLGFFLVMILALLIAMNNNRFYIFKSIFQKYLTAILILTILLTTSTTAYVGLLFIILLNILLELKSDKIVQMKISRKVFNLIKISALIISLTLIVFIVLAFIFDIGYSDMVNIFKVFTTEKVSTEGPGQIRLILFKEGISILRESFFMGTGWGTNRTVDLLSTLLANIGVFGTILFITMVAVPLRYSFSLYKSVCNLNHEMAIVCYSIFCAFMAALFLNLIAIPDFSFMYYWVVFGLLLSLPKVYKNINQAGIKAE